MTVTYQGCDSVRGSLKDGDKTYIETHKLYTDGPPIAVPSPPAGSAAAVSVRTVAAALFSAVSYAKIGVAYTEDTATKCVGVEVVSKGKHTTLVGKWEWEGTITLSSKTEKEQSDKTNPTEWATKVNVSGEEFKQGASADIAGVKLSNAIGEPIPWDESYSRPVVTVEKYYTTWDFRRCRDSRKSAQGFRYSRNQADFTVTTDPWQNFTIGAGRGLIVSLDVTPAFVNGGVYAKLAAKITEDLDAHKVLLLNQGNAFFNGDKIVPDMIGGVPNPAPIILNEDGTKWNPLTEDEPPALEFQFKPLRDWSTIGLASITF